MKKKIIILGAIFVALLMLLIPAVSSIEANVVKEAIKEDSSCTICAMLSDEDVAVSKKFYILLDEFKENGFNYDLLPCDSSDSAICRALQALYFVVGFFVLLGGGMCTVPILIPIGLLIFIVSIVPFLIIGMTGMLFDCELELY